MLISKDLVPKDNDLLLTRLALENAQRPNLAAFNALKSLGCYILWEMRAKKTPQRSGCDILREDAIQAC